MLLLRTNILFLVITECFAHYETLIVSNEPLELPASSVKLLENTAMSRDSIILVAVVKEIPTLDKSSPKDKYSIDRDDYVDLAITFETIRKGNGVKVVDNSYENAVVNSGVWRVIGNVEDAVHSDIVNAISKEEPNEPNITILFTTCPLVEPGPDEKVHGLPRGYDSFKTVASHPDYFASLILVMIVSSLV